VSAIQEVLIRPQEIPAVHVWTVTRLPPFLSNFYTVLTPYGPVLTPFLWGNRYALTSWQYAYASVFTHGSARTSMSCSKDDAYETAPDREPFGRSHNWWRSFKYS
jgi:hypothetical protein